jgi:hypothetical protein
MTLELDVGADPIAGTLRDRRGHSVEFSGWLGLAAALEEVVSATGRPSVPPAREKRARSPAPRARG